GASNRPPGPCNPRSDVVFRPYLMPRTAARNRTVTCIYRSLARSWRTPARLGPDGRSRTVPDGSGRRHLHASHVPLAAPQDEEPAVEEVGRRRHGVLRLDL